MDDVFALTDKGQRELQSGSTSLSPAQLELLVRVDGKLTLRRIRPLMQASSEEAFLSLFQSLHARGLVARAEVDQLGAELQASMEALGSGDDLHAGRASAERKGYVVRIAKEGDARAPSGGQLCAVVVEDDALVARFLQSFLKLEGFEVRLASDRATAVAELNKRPVPDVILLDVMLPDVDGFAILEKLQSHPVLRQAPVIMLTGSDTRGAVIRGLAGGAAGYLTKPVDPESLLRAVRTVLGRPQAAQGLWTETSRHGSA